MLDRASLPVHREVITIRLSWKQCTPCVLTVAALTAGFLSILITLNSIRLEKASLQILSAQFIMIAMILDGLDGVLARFIGGTSEFGAELDTFVDFSAFGIAPAVLIHAVSFPTGNPWLCYVLPCLIVLSGAVRLARFRIIDPLRGEGGYTGLPITINAAWIALAVFVTRVSYPGQGVLQSGPFALFFYASIMLLISLQVSTIKYPKAVKHMGIFFGLILLVALVWVLDRGLGVMIAGGLILGGAAFVFVPIIKSSLQKRAQ